MSTDPQSHIVEAALQQIREGGLDSLSVRNVAARAHYSPAGLYRHFESVDELHAAVGLKVTGEFKTHLWSQLAVDPNARTAARATAEWVDANPEVSELIVQCTADKFMKSGDDQTWFSFSDSDADEDQKMRTAILGWDILRSLLHLRTVSDFDFEGLFEASTEFIRSAQADGLV